MKKFADNHTTSAEYYGTIHELSSRGSGPIRELPVRGQFVEETGVTHWRWVDDCTPEKLRSVHINVQIAIQRIV